MDSAGYSVSGFPIPKKVAQELLEKLVTPSGILLKVLLTATFAL